MAMLPLATCARMLGIHPKTLHQWLDQACLPMTTHPTDARIKCVAEEHLREVARLHGRSLSDHDFALSPPAASPVEQAKPLEIPEPDCPQISMAQSLAPTADLTQKLLRLETQIATLQEQVAQLALTLLHEREQAVERRILALEALTQSLLGAPGLPASPAQEAGQVPACATRQQRRLLPAEQRARSCLPALIEYGAQGTYVIISSQEGELHLKPDTAEWFEWLATLTSFRFVGKLGRFTAYRRGRESRSWRAHRCVHQRTYRQPLGITDQLTLDGLEQAAATLQANIALLS